MTTILEQYVRDFDAGIDLRAGDAEVFLDAMIEENDEPLLGNVFRAWDRKGIAEDEIYAIASLMCDRCTRLSTRHKTFVDIVGTGGSRSKTFNVSTASAFVVAGAGVPVAKHGNRAATSNSGSADVLSALGVEPAVSVETAELCLNEIGMCFMFAPNFHRLSPTLGKVRRGLGFPTIFNCVGPLCNPASAPHQLIGVWSKEMVPKIANALCRLGTVKSWIVHGSDGLDEISIGGSTIVAEVANGSVREFEIAPADFSMTPADLDGIRVTTSEESAAIIRGVLSGDCDRAAVENVVLMNAAAAYYLAGRADSIVNAVGAVSESITSGAAMRKLGQLAEAVRQ